ncbi:hypothetical protein [Nocardia sp. R6R-6]|uniref:hypothetical protein n=1 Tax=Nocardia sp. R6R-6 TaxID=3459303 RepID=UPI00403E0FFF
MSTPATDTTRGRRATSVPDELGGVCDVDSAAAGLADSRVTVEPTEPSGAVVPAAYPVAARVPNGAHR